MLSLRLFRSTFWSSRSSIPALRTSIAFGSFPGTAFIILTVFTKLLHMLGAFGSQFLNRDKAIAITIDFSEFTLGRLHEFIFGNLAVLVSIIIIEHAAQHILRAIMLSTLLSGRWGSLLILGKCSWRSHNHRQ